MVADKAEYYAVTNGLPQIECYLYDDGSGPKVGGPHADAINAIADNAPGFVAWKAAKHIKQIDAAWKAKRDEAGWDWSSGPMVWDMAKNNAKVKNKAVRDWVLNDLYGVYRTRKQGLLNGSLQWDESLLAFSDCPYTPDEIFVEAME